MRSLECVYPNKRRKVVTPPDAMDSISEKPLVRFCDAEIKVQQPCRQQYAPPFQEIVFSHTSESSYQEGGQLEMASNAPTSTTTYQVHPSPPQSSLRHNSLEFASNLRQPVAGLLRHNPLQVTTNEVPVSDQLVEQHHYPNVVQNDYQPAYSTHSAQYAYDDSYDDSMNLNWIPLSFYPSPYGDMEHDFSFLLPSLPETAGMGTAFDAVTFDTSLPQTLHKHSSEPYVPHMISDFPKQASLMVLEQSPDSSIGDGLPVIRSLHEESGAGPKTKRRKFSHVQESFTKARTTRRDYGFPDTSDQTLNHNNRQDLCSEAQYSSIRSTFELLCLSPSSRAPFRTSRFPERVIINHCIGLYLECFHSSFPLLHISTIGEDTSCLVLLATAAVGSSFVSVPACVDFREAFQEFLRRATQEFDLDNFQDLSFAQARILNLICTVQAGRTQSKSLAPHYHAELSRWCLESGLLQITVPDEEHNDTLSSSEKKTAWHRWIKQESERRIGYMIWLLDCALGYLCNTRPLCNMDDARAPLPCAEKLWDAENAEQWFEHKLTTSTMPSLCSALEAMYNMKRLDPAISEISNILLVHALYSRTWEVGTHIKQPLSEWKATGDARGFLNTPSKDNFWLPLYPLYANWRNSACDCLDVLQWHASGIVAKAAGSEHHGVLHLHLARIILLTPFQEIQDLLFFLINHNVGEDSKATFYVHDGSYQRRHPAKLAQIRNITSRWLRGDQHKARLAMVHAGSVFWHVRRYSSNSFFEPLAIYLASIVLWTYGSYKSAALEREAADASQRVTASRRESPDINIQPSRVELASRSHAASSRKSTSSHSTNDRSNSHASPSTTSNKLGHSHHAEHNHQSSPVTNQEETDDASDSDQSQDQPEFIHLDRPCDDEIVQHFVRSGHNMAGYMSNVGDICKTPQKVLIEGAKLLRTKLSCWGVSREYHDVLLKLAEIRKDGRGGNGGAMNGAASGSHNANGLGKGIKEDEAV